MAYWIIEAGNSNNANYRGFYCDYLSDISKLPTQTKEGAPQEGDTVSSKPCSAGSNCVCLENSNVYVLGKDTDQWKQL